jgi:hypothetical protein
MEQQEKKNKNKSVFTWNSQHHYSLKRLLHGLLGFAPNIILFPF